MLLTLIANRHFGMDAEIQRPWMASLGITARLPLASEFHVPVTGCIRDIHVTHPLGGEAVQIGNPADLSCNPAGMTAS